MLVRDCMTRGPLVVRPDSDPVAALQLLKAGGFRHLPVVDAAGSLVGLVERAEIEQFLQGAGSPGVLKRQHRVDQVMRSDVVTVSPDCPLEEAASLMVRRKINSLPVVEGGAVVGIVTETDIFKQFAAVLGGGTESLRLTVRVPDAPGVLADLAGRIARVGGNVCSIVQYPSDSPASVNITLRVRSADRQAVLDAVLGVPGLELVSAWGVAGPKGC